MQKLVLLMFALGAWMQLSAAKTLDLYFIDVEGGQATLMVTPSGQSMLIDTGWPGFSARDASRIAAAAKQAGVKQLDYVLITHFHTDHVGGITQLTQKLPVKEFLDHGASVEKGREPEALYATYEKATQGKTRTALKVGDRIALKGVEARVVSADGNVLTEPLPSAGAANSLCEATPKKDEDKSENARSVGVWFQYGKFRFIDLGDLTWNKELELACPQNRLGQVDLYLTTHHGMNMSGPAAIVQALHPRVAVMNNGAKKGGSPEAWQAVKQSPGLEDMWQLHFAVAGGKENNVNDTFIANLEEQCAGNYLKVSVEQNGAFTVSNSRNKYSKKYNPR